MSTVPNVASMPLSGISVMSSPEVNSGTMVFDKTVFFRRFAGTSPPMGCDIYLGTLTSGSQLMRVDGLINPTGSNQDHPIGAGEGFLPGYRHAIRVYLETPTHEVRMFVGHAMFASRRYKVVVYYTHV